MQSSPTRAPGPIVTFGNMTVLLPTCAPSATDTNGTYRHVLADLRLGRDGRERMDAGRWTPGRGEKSRPRGQKPGRDRVSGASRMAQPVRLHEAGPLKRVCASAPTRTWDWPGRSDHLVARVECPPPERSRRRHPLRGGIQGGRPAHEASRCMKRIYHRRRLRARCNAHRPVR